MCTSHLYATLDGKFEISSHCLCYGDKRRLMRAWDDRDITLKAVKLIESSFYLDFYVF